MVIETFFTVKPYLRPMSLDIGEAIENGLERALNRNSAILMGLFFVVSIISQVFGDTVMRNLIEEGNFGPEFSEIISQFSISELAPLALGLSTEVAMAGSILLSFLSVLITVGAVRAFLDDGELNIEASYFTDNILWVLANVVAGAVVFSLVLAAGFTAFIIPGVFLFVSLFFWSFYVIDQDLNFFEALKSAWRDTKGNRFMTLALLFIVFIGNAVLTTVVGGLLSVVGSTIGGLALGSVLGLVPSAIGMVLTWAIFTEGYRQISE